MMYTDYLRITNHQAKGPMINEVVLPVHGSTMKIPNITINRGYLVSLPEIQTQGEPHGATVQSLERTCCGTDLDDSAPTSLIVVCYYAQL